MPRKRFRCSRCGRSFSMPGHLGRHMNAIHGRGKNKKKSYAPKKHTRGRGTVSVLSDGWTHLVERVEAYGRELEAQLSALGNRLHGARHAVETLRGLAGAGARKRRRRRRKA